MRKKTYFYFSEYQAGLCGGLWGYPNSVVIGKKRVPYTECCDSRDMSHSKVTDYQYLGWRYEWDTIIVDDKETWKKCKENKMKDKDKFAEVKIEDLKKTYDEECDDVKRVLRKMYPEIFREEKKYCCDWMKKAVEEVGLIRKDSIIYRFKQRPGMYIGEDCLNYCPRCGEKI